MQQVAGGEIDEQQAGAVVEVQVAQRLIKGIAGEVGQHQGVAVFDAHEARAAAPVRDVGAGAGGIGRSGAIQGSEGGIAGDEQGIGRFDQGAVGPVQGAALFHPQGAGQVDEMRFAALDVLRAVAEALGHGQGETVGIDLADGAVEAVAPARGQLDAQQAEARAGAQVGRQDIARQRTAVDAQGLRVGRMQEAGLAGQHRSPRLAAGIDAADQDEGQLGKKLTVLLRHVIANAAPAGDGRLGEGAGALLDRQFAGVKRRRLPRAA